MEVPASLVSNGIVLHVRLTPRSRTAHIGSLETYGGKTVIKAHVTPPPEDGKANAALATLVAHWLGVAKTTVTVAAGHKSRLKSVAVAGHAGDLMQKLSILLASSSGIPGKKGTGEDHG